MQDDMAEIGQRIRELRGRRGLTQGQVAEAIGAADDSVVSKIEHGTRGLAAAELASLCEYFGVASDEILFGRDHEPAGVLLRATDDVDAARVVEHVEQAFADLRYVRALVES